MHQAYLIAYQQTKSHDETERDVEMAKAMSPRIGGGKAKKGRRRS